MSDEWITLNEPPACTRIPGSRILTEVNLHRDEAGNYYKSLVVTKDGVKQPVSWYRLNDERRLEVLRAARTLTTPRGERA